MNSAARKKRIEVSSINNLANQMAPRHSLNVQRQQNTPTKSQSPQKKELSTETAKTPFVSKTGPSLFTLPEVIKVIDSRLIALESIERGFHSVAENSFSVETPNLEDIIMEMGELRENLLKVEERQHAVAKFISESMRILFEKTGCEPNELLINLGELIGIEVVMKNENIIIDTFVDN